MSVTRDVLLVAGRELRERVRSRSFLVSTVLLLVLVVGFVVAPAVVGRLAGPPHWRLGATVPLPPGFAAAVAGAESGATAEVVPLPDGAAASALAAGRVDLVVTAGPVLVTEDTDRTLIAAAAAALGAARAATVAAELGIDPAELARLSDAAQVPVETVARRAGARERRTFAAFLGPLLVFVAIVTYGQWILVGVVEEKANRVVEVLLGTMRAEHLLAGKILGIGLLGVLQLLLVSATGIVALLVTGSLSRPVGLGAAGLLAAGWFVLGFAFYATAYGAAGALVSRVEDAQNAAFPLTMLLMVGYLAAAFSLTGGDNPVLRALSLLPPWAPLTMPMRQVLGTAAPWEVGISVALTALTALLLVRGAGRVYAGGLLRPGRRTGLREAWRGARG